ncbi:HAMP domain-containing protein, partial [bacterium]|nr:HAMP domain-containing protein [bacterium]
GIVVMAMIVTFTVYYTTWARIMDEFYDVARIASQFAPLFNSVNQTMLMILLVFLVLVAVFSIFVSHQIAGPIYRFEKTLQAVAGGDLTMRVGLRKRDEFKHLADSMNEMVGELRNNLSSNRVLIEEMIGIFERIEESGDWDGSALPSGLTEDLEKMNQILLRLQQNVQRYKLK